MAPEVVEAPAVAVDPIVDGSRREMPVVAILDVVAGEAQDEEVRVIVARCHLEPGDGVVDVDPREPRVDHRVERDVLGRGRTRVHFTETYHVFNPLMRALLERRVHRFISSDNDVLMKQAVEGGVAAMRKRARSQAGNE